PHRRSRRRVLTQQPPHLAADLRPRPDGAARPRGARAPHHQHHPARAQEEPRMRIALCNEVIAPMPFPQQCEYAAKLGYDGLEIAPYTLSDEPHRLGTARLAAARAAAEEAGIAVTGLHWLLVKPAGLSISTRDETVRRKTV